MSLLVIKKKFVEFKNYLIQSKKVVENNRISVPMHYVNTFGNHKTLLLATIFTNGYLLKHPISFEWLSSLNSIRQLKFKKKKKKSKIAPFQTLKSLTHQTNDSSNLVKDKQYYEGRY